VVLQQFPEMANPSKEAEREHLIEDLPKPESQLRSHLIGFGLAILAGVCFTIYNTFFKMIRSIPISEILFVEGFGQLLLDVPFLISNRTDLRGFSGSRLVLLLFSSLLYILLTYSNFYVVKIIPLGDALALQFTAPIFGMIIGSCFLKEGCSFLKTTMLLIFLIGIILLTKPPGILHIFGIIELETLTSLEVYGYIIGIGGAIGMAFLYIIMEKLMHNSTDSYLIIFSNATLMMLVSVIITPLIQRIPYLTHTKTSYWLS